MWFCKICSQTFIAKVKIKNCLFFQDFEFYEQDNLDLNFKQHETFFSFLWCFNDFQIRKIGINCCDIFLEWVYVINNLG